MKQLLTVAILFVVIITMMKGIAVLSGAIAKKFKFNERAVSGIVIFAVFVICSYLWNFTGFYEVLSSFTGIPLEKQ